MQLSQLGKQLATELRRSPKKAALLAAAILLALWMWAPLVAGWFTPTGEEPDTIAVAPPHVAAPATAPVAPRAAKRVNAAAWFASFDELTSDPLRQVASTPEKQNPFAASRITPVEPEKPKPQETAPDPRPEITPQQAGLVLTSTSIAGRNRLAIISGKAYREGERVAASLSDRASETALGDTPNGGSAENAEPAFTIERIEPRAVILRLGDKTYPLRLKQRPRGEGRVELVPG